MSLKLEENLDNAINVIGNLYDTNELLTDATGEELKNKIVRNLQKGLCLGTWIGARESYLDNLKAVESEQYESKRGSLFIEANDYYLDNVFKFFHVEIPEEFRNKGSQFYEAYKIFQKNLNSLSLDDQSRIYPKLKIALRGHVKFCTDLREKVEKLS